MEFEKRKMDPTISGRPCEFEDCEHLTLKIQDKEIWVHVRSVKKKDGVYQGNISGFIDKKGLPLGYEQEGKTVGDTVSFVDSLVHRVQYPRD